MPAFSYTTGNPNNLVANQNASMADIQGPFTDLRTFLNGGTMDETNVPNLAAAFTTYKRIVRGAAQLTNPASATYLLNISPLLASAQNNVAPSSSFATSTDFLFYLDPTLYAANSRVTRLQLRTIIIPGSTAPGITYTAGLYPVATYGTGSNPVIQTVGTVVSGSTVAIASPAASTLSTNTSSDFNFPAGGAYVLGVVPSSAAAAGTVVHVISQLEMRQV